MYDVKTQLFPQFLTFKITEGSFAREDVATLRTKYDTGRDLFALETLAAPSHRHPVLSSSSHLSNFFFLLIYLTYISHHKKESKRKLALHQDDSIHITNETVENCANSICISRQFEYASDHPSQMRRRPTEQVAEHCQLQTATNPQVGLWQMRTRLNISIAKDNIFIIIDAPLIAIKLI